uniref:Uncharacterized protein n=1 Tax=Oryza barthii TaxID=65489 RepID=A0A0D3G9Y3_9ORYZ
MVDMQFSHFYGVGGLKSGATLTRTRRSPPASSRRSAPAPVGTSSTVRSHCPLRVFLPIGYLQFSGERTRARRIPCGRSGNSARCQEASGVVEEGVVRVGRQGWSWTGRRGVAPALRFDGTSASTTPIAVLREQACLWRFAVFRVLIRIHELISEEIAKGNIKSEIQIKEPRVHRRLNPMIDYLIINCRLLDRIGGQPTTGGIAPLHQIKALLLSDGGGVMVTHAAMLLVLSYYTALLGPLSANVRNFA